MYMSMSSLHMIYITVHVVPVHVRAAIGYRIRVHVKAGTYSMVIVSNVP